MDLKKLSNDEMEVLFAVFDSFDQGDVSSDLENRFRNEEEEARIYETYDKMRKSIFEEGIHRRSMHRVLPRPT